MNQALAIVLAILAVILTALAQILLKSGAMRAHGRHILLTWFHPLVLCGYGLLGLVTLINLMAFRILPLKTGVVILPLVFILVALFSRIFLGERLHKEQLKASLLILVGLVIFLL